MTRLPSPTTIHPIRLSDGSAHKGTVYLNAVLDHPNIEVGDYTYYSDLDGDPAEDIAQRLAPYLYLGATDRLVIGRYCQIASGVRFITAGANHATGTLTAFPFPVFDPATILDFHPDTRDTFVGHDVWLGYGALVCPGARIGSGAIVGAGAVVRGEIPPYAVVTGNPAEVRRLRFSDAHIAELLALAWWDWPADRVAAAWPALSSGDVARLAEYAP
ncbi:MAG: CatB-related O-acetyltransferase [Pseudomonadota bacterium]